ADILRALLDGASNFSARVALFVVKGGAAAGWQARGFDDNNSIKKISVDPASGPAGDALQKRKAVSASASDFDAKFVHELGAPKRGDAHIIPLVLRDKVPALLYADSGTQSGGEADAHALQLLVRSAGLWLEILTLRKSGAAPATLEATAVAEAAAPPVQEHAHAAAAASEAASAPAHEAASAPISAADDDIHKTAKRFAKL